MAVFSARTSSLDSISSDGSSVDDSSVADSEVAKESTPTPNHRMKVPGGPPVDSSVSSLSECRTKTPAPEASSSSDVHMTTPKARTRPLAQSDSDSFFTPPIPPASGPQRSKRVSRQRSRSLFRDIEPKTLKESLGSLSDVDSIRELLGDSKRSRSAQDVGNGASETKTEALRRALRFSQKMLRKAEESEKRARKASRKAKEFETVADKERVKARKLEEKARAIDRELREVERKRALVSQALAEAEERHRQAEQILIGQLNDAQRQQGWANSDLNAARQSASNLQQRLYQEEQAHQRVIDELRFSQRTVTNLEEMVRQHEMFKQQLLNEVHAAQRERDVFQSKLDQANNLVDQLNSELEKIKHKQGSTNANHNVPPFFNTSSYSHQSHQPRFSQAPQNTAPKPQPPPSSPPDQYLTNPTSNTDWARRYDTLWSYIDNGLARHATPLTFTEVPWPLLKRISSPEEITMEDIKEFYRAYFEYRNVKPEERRSVFKAEILRWHTDKCAVIPNVYTFHQSLAASGVLSAIQFITQLPKDPFLDVKNTAY
ncbi:hypothetical protein C8Q75DRAFT_803601 [Abortiporus biennis]|nr:hypothetical protein C8Q75DRAFT_803601 [Abortiporus biennis]